MYTTNYTSPSFSSAGVIWLKLAVLYLVLGIGLGIVMGATRDFSLRSVHAHINLLGWATTALAGLIYSIFPRAGESRLATIHFWLHNISLPVMMLALSFLLFGNEKVVPVLVAAELTAALGVIVFAANIFINLGKD
jgi:hypothetical protein